MKKITEPQTRVLAMLGLGFVFGSQPASLAAPVRRLLRRGLVKHIRTEPGLDVYKLTQAGIAALVRVTGVSRPPRKQF